MLILASSKPSTLGDVSFLITQKLFCCQNCMLQALKALLKLPLYLQRLVPAAGHDAAVVWRFNPVDCFDRTVVLWRDTVNRVRWSRSNLKTATTWPSFYPTCAICIVWLLLRSHILAVLSQDAVKTLLPSFVKRRAPCKLFCSQADDIYRWGLYYSLDVHRSSMHPTLDPCASVGL